MRLSKLAFKNISWASASQIGRQIIQYSTTLVLVYNLDPKDFGLMALAIMIVNFLEVFKDLGTGAAIIQKPDISEKFLSSVFWTNIIIGFTVALIMIFISNLAGYFFHNYQLPDVLKVMSLAFIVSSLISTCKYQYYFKFWYYK